MPISPKERLVPTRFGELKTQWAHGELKELRGVFGVIDVKIDYDQSKIVVVVDTQKKNSRDRITGIFAAKGVQQSEYRIDIVEPKYSEQKQREYAFYANLQKFTAIPGCLSVTLSNNPQEMIKILIDPEVDGACGAVCALMTQSGYPAGSYALILRHYDPDPSLMEEESAPEATPIEQSSAPMKPSQSTMSLLFSELGGHLKNLISVLRRRKKPSQLSGSNR